MYFYHMIFNQCFDKAVSNRQIILPILLNQKILLIPPRPEEPSQP